MPSPKTPDTKQEMAQGAVDAPEGSRPWEDSTLSAEERYKSYYDLARAKCEAIRDAGNRPGVSALERYTISQDPEANFWVNEFRQVKGEGPEAFCRRFDERVARELLGKNYLGAEAWRSQGVDVGAAPPLPPMVTKALLNSECPLHPGQRIKDTHLLVLVPKTVNGAPYSALKLDELCEGRKGSGARLIYDNKSWATRWKSESWASALQAESEWVLLPKRDPDPGRVSARKHFREKKIAGQQHVHSVHYQEYREAKTIEVMTAVLLYDLNSKERLLPDWLRCAESSGRGGRVLVGWFADGGLRVITADADDTDDPVGRALARK